MPISVAIEAVRAQARMNRGHVSKKDMTKGGTTKSTVVAAKTKNSGRRSAKLKLSGWYQGAARSIAITKERPLARADEMIE
jgi:hypothetical protein